MNPAAVISYAKRGGDRLIGRNISFSLTVFFITSFILIWTLIITVTMSSHCIIKCNMEKIMEVAFLNKIVYNINEIQP